jgi:hypothetical protein
METTYIFRLRPPIKILAGKVRCVLQLLLLRVSFLTIVSSQSIKSREDKRCGFGERNTVCLAHGGSQTMLGLLSDAFWRSKIRLDYFVDVNSNFHVVGFGFPCQYHTVETARAIETIIDLVKKTVVSTQERKLANKPIIYRVKGSHTCVDFARSWLPEL